MKTPRYPKSAAAMLCALLSFFFGPTLAQAKRDIEGQVFIVTKGGENVKLGLVPIWVLGEYEMKALAKQAVELADAATLKKKFDEEGKKLRDLEDKAATDLTESGLQKVKAAVSEEREAMRKSFESLAPKAERGIRLIEKIDKQKRGLDSGEIFSRVMLGSEFATKILVGLLAEKESDMESDADGRFKFSAENGSGWVVAYGQRNVGTIGQTNIQNSEQYYWVVELPQKKPQVFLSSNDCDIAEAEAKLRLLASETKTSAADAVVSANRTLSTSGRPQQVYSDEKAAQERLKAAQERLKAAQERLKAEKEERLKAEKERIASEERARLRKEAVAAGKMLLDQNGFALVLVPGGKFNMGSRDQSDNPVHAVNVSAFFIGETEVTYGEWKSILEWAKGKGYDFSNGKGVSDKHPVTDVSWHDAVKWCNAKSEMEGFVPVYKVKGGGYREGEENEVTCDWKANGYRLPTEAEWEKAALGGLVGKQFPNGDTLEKKDANFEGGGTVEVGKYPANGYGLYDMAGNVWEWCWDLYAFERLGVDDPKGPQTGVLRVRRGGSWYSGAAYCRAADRNSSRPDDRYYALGFRVARVPSR